MVYVNHVTIGKGNLNCVLKKEISKILKQVMRKFKIIDDRKENFFLKTIYKNDIYFV